MKKNETGAQSKKYVRSLATYLLLDIALNISQLEMHIQYTVYSVYIYNIQYTVYSCTAYSVFMYSYSIRLITK